MYTVYADGQLLYSPQAETGGVGIPKLRQAANRFSTLTFTLYPDHPLYGNLKKRTSILTVYRDDDRILEMRPTYSRITFQNGIEYMCEECTASLNDFKVRPYDRTDTIAGFFDFVLSNYNARSVYKIKKGAVLVTSIQNGKFASKAYEGYWEALQTQLVKKYGGYLVFRYESDGVYLDYLREEDLPLSGQEIRFGENLASLFIDTDADDTYSMLVPIGADYQDIDDYGEQVTKQVNITSVNGGKDYIENENAIALYGKRELYRRWEYILDPNVLLLTARDYLNTSAIKLNENVGLTAVDLHNASVEIPALQCMTRIKATSEKHGLSSVYVLSELETPLDAPDKSSVQLGGEKRTLTDRIVEGSEQTRLTAIAAQTALTNVSDTTQSGINGVQIQANDQKRKLDSLFGTGENVLFQMVYATEEGQKNQLILNQNWKLSGDIQ